MFTYLINIKSSNNTSDRNYAYLPGYQLLVGSFKPTASRLRHPCSIILCTNFHMKSEDSKKSTATSILFISTIVNSPIHHIVQINTKSHLPQLPQHFGMYASTNLDSINISYPPSTTIPETVPSSPPRSQPHSCFRPRTPLRFWLFLISFRRRTWVRLLPPFLPPGLLRAPGVPP